MHEWGLGPLASDVELLTSEMVTNAYDASVVLPDQPPIALRLLASEASLVIEVWDQSPLDLERSEPDDEAECGRGLLVVQALSKRWGVKRTGYNRKVVWCEVEVARGVGR
jgi:anti-sigma regulatory factor (Ser/Thr protein kinase)